MILGVNGDFCESLEYSQTGTEENDLSWLFTCEVESDSFVTPWTTSWQAPLSMGFSRQEYWSGLPCPSPGDLLDPGIKSGDTAVSTAFVF